MYVTIVDAYWKGEKNSAWSIGMYGLLICRYINRKEREQSIITVSQLYDTLCIFKMAFTSLKTQLTYCRKFMLLTFHSSVPCSLMLENSAFAYSVYLFVSCGVLGTFEKLQKPNISFVVSVRPFVCPFGSPQGTTLLPKDGFSWNLLFSIFEKPVTKIQVSLKSHKNKGHFKANIYFWSYLAQFFL
jgi:hypothetical protein